jgi:phage gp29-like protein
MICSTVIPTEDPMIVETRPLAISPDLPKEETFAEIPTGSLVREIATRAESGDYAGLATWLPNPDPILRKAGIELETYTELLSDAFTKGCIRGLESKILSRKWRLKGEKVKTRSREITEKALRRMPMRRIWSEILDAFPYGHNILEILYAVHDGGLILPENVVGKPRRWFLVTPANEWRFLQRGSGVLEGVALPPRKFLIVVNEPTFDNPYGEALLSCCYWPIVLKRGVLKHWTLERERFGMPWTVYQYPLAWVGDMAKIRSQVRTITQLTQDGVLAIPQGSQVGFERGSEGSGSTQYREFLEWCDTQISVALLGHEGGANATPGALGDQASAVEVRGDIIDSGIALIESAMNELIRNIYEINFDEEEVPEFEVYAEDEVQMGLVNRTKMLKESGILPTRAYVINRLGLKEDEFELESESAPPPETPTPQIGEGEEGGSPSTQTGGTAMPGSSQGTPAEASNPSTPPGGGTGGGNAPQGAAEFAEAARGISLPEEFPDEKLLDAVYGKLSPETMQLQMEKILRPVLGVLQKATSYEDALRQLVKIFPKMNTADLQNTLEKGILLAEVIGRNSVHEEIRADGEDPSTIERDESNVTDAAIEGIPEE